MKLSKKNRKSIMEAIASAAYTMLNEQCPSCQSCGPDEWSPSEKQQWDIISETQHRIEKSVEKVMEE